MSRLIESRAGSISVGMALTGVVLLVMAVAAANAPSAGAATAGPHLTLTKVADPTTGAYPLTVNYTYTVTNDGSDTLFHLAVTDDHCGQVIYQSGDTNRDQLIEPGETWVFSCTQTLTLPGDNTNSATAMAFDTQTGLAVSSNSS